MAATSTGKFSLTAFTSPKFQAPLNSVSQVATPASPATFFLPFVTDESGDRLRVIVNDDDQIYYMQSVSYTLVKEFCPTLAELAEASKDGMFRLELFEKVEAVWGFLRYCYTLEYTDSRLTGSAQLDFQVRMYDFANLYDVQGLAGKSFDGVRSRIGAMQSDWVSRSSREVLAAIVAIYDVKCSSPTVDILKEEILYLAVLSYQTLRLLADPDLPQLLKDLPALYHDLYAHEGLLMAGPDQNGVCGPLVWDQPVWEANVQESITDVFPVNPANTTDQTLKKEQDEKSSQVRRKLRLPAVAFMWCPREVISKKPMADNGTGRVGHTVPDDSVDMESAFLEDDDDDDRSDTTPTPGSPVTHAASATSHVTTSSLPGLADSSSSSLGLALRLKSATEANPEAKTETENIEQTNTRQNKTSSLPFRSMSKSHDDPLRELLTRPKQSAPSMSANAQTHKDSVADPLPTKGQDTKLDASASSSTSPKTTTTLDLSRYRISPAETKSSTYGFTSSSDNSNDYRHRPDYLVRPKQYVPQPVDPYNAYPQATSHQQSYQPIDDHKTSFSDRTLLQRGLLDNAPPAHGTAPPTFSPTKRDPQAASTSLKLSSSAARQAKPSTTAEVSSKKPKIESPASKTASLSRTTESAASLSSWEVVKEPSSVVALDASGEEALAWKSSGETDTEAEMTDFEEIEISKTDDEWDEVEIEQGKGKGKAVEKEK
ncbi:MAG: hypothetical protein M1814_000671 [Vezdaea aestivalis]|nr:MAG: hypothetical protein M1814_000671 [Vezdaea aestivalis]